MADILHIKTDDLAWQASPVAGIWRKRLEHTGPVEKGRVTSLVRFDAGAKFPHHDHPDGEEIFVLEGDISDEHGNFSAGTYLLNPDGSSHAPWTDQGCLLFVKLQQSPGAARRAVCCDSGQMDWQASDMPGIEMKILYESTDWPERFILYRAEQSCQVEPHLHSGGEEVYVIKGGYEDEYGRYGAASWIRYPAGSRHASFVQAGTMLFAKTGHLSA